MPIGVPGWPELAFWTASMQSVRMVLTARRVGQPLPERAEAAERQPGRGALHRHAVLQPDVARRRPHQEVEDTAADRPSFGPRVVEGEVALSQLKSDLGLLLRFQRHL